MAKRRRKKKSILYSIFYRVYFALVVVGVFGIIFGMNYLYGLLADYESAQPTHVAETAARLFENADYDTIYEYDTSAADVADGDKDFYLESMHTIADGQNVTWSAAYSPSEDEKRYNVLLADEKFAEISLVPSGRVTDHGYRIWRLGSVTTYVTMGEQEVPEEEEEIEEPIIEEEVEEVPAGFDCRITVPSESTVVVNGARLTAQDAVNTDIPTASAELLPEKVPSPTMTEYQFYSETETPEIAVTDKYGNPQTPVAEGDHSWSCPLPETPGLKEKYEKAAVNVAQQLAKLSARTITREKMLGYCASNSPARSSVSKYDTSVGYSSKAGKFENIVTSDYYQYSDDCFSCHVSFDYISRFSSQVSKSYSTAFTLYFIRQGGKGKLYNFTFY